MNLENQTWKEVDESNPQIALFPMGSTEQHGPHAPLCTDTLIATEIAREAGKRVDTVVLPVIPIGIAEEHRDFPGTLYTSPDTHRALTRDVMKSLEYQGFKAVIAVNGHGGNIEALEETCANITRSKEIWATSWTWWKAVSSANLGHGGELETSLVLHLRPDLVDMEKAEKGADTWGRRVEGAETSYDSHEFTEDGVIGDPRNASKDKGEELFIKSVDSLCDLVQWIREEEPWS